MIPAILGLDSLLTKVAAAAVVPRIVRALSALGGPPEPIRAYPTQDAKEHGSAPAREVEKPLYGRNPGLRHTRAYDAANKRWISRDPLGEGVDYNLYRYCGNSPINNVDPAGLRPISDAPWDTPVPIPIGAIQDPPGYPGNPFSGAGDAARGWGAALGNLGKWLQGKEIQSDYGPDTIQVRQLRFSPGVNRARDFYKKKNKGKKCPDAVTDFDVKFGVLQFIDAIPNGTRHFVGTYSLDIYPVGNDRVYFTLRNTTGRTSFLYQMGAEGSDTGWGRDQSQTYHWEEYLPSDD